LRRCITNLVEIDERFGDREEEWGVVTGRWDEECCGCQVGWGVSEFGYVYGEGAVFNVVGVRGCDGGIRRLELGRGGEA